jgi:plastocyanin
MSAMSSTSTAAVGAVVAILILGAVASIGYYQFVVAPAETATGATTATTPAGVDCITSPSSCVNVTIINGAGTPYSGYPGTTTLFGYSPTTITVVIGVNNTVVWTNEDTTAFHTATSLAGDPASFDSGCLDGVGVPCPSSTGVSTFQYTFTVAGTYNYHCSFHAWMTGVVIVKAASGSQASTS